MRLKAVPKSLQYAFSRSYCHFFFLVPRLTQEELLQLVWLFDLLHLTSFKQIPSFECSYRCFCGVVYLVSLVVSGDTRVFLAGSTLVPILRLVSKMVKHIVTSTPGAKVIIFQNLLKYSIEMTFDTKNASNYCNSNCSNQQKIFGSFLKQFREKELCVSQNRSQLFSHSFFLQFLFSLLFCHDGIIDPRELDLVCSSFLSTLSESRAVDACWPDEITISRCPDSYHRFHGRVSKNPVLKFIFESIASLKPDKRFFVMLIRSYFAVVLLQWNSVKQSKASEYLKQDTRFLLNLLQTSNLLPPRFCTLIEFLEQIVAFNVYYIFSCLWRIYSNILKPLEEKLSSDFSLTVDDTDFKPLLCLIKAIIMTDIRRLGHHYKAFFQS